MGKGGILFKRKVIINHNLKDRLQVAVVVAILHKVVVTQKVKVKHIVKIIAIIVVVMEILLHNLIKIHKVVFLSQKRNIVKNIIKKPKI